MEGRKSCKRVQYRAGMIRIGDIEIVMDPDTQKRPMLHVWLPDDVRMIVQSADKSCKKPRSRRKIR